MGRPRIREGPAAHGDPDLQAVGSERGELGVLGDVVWMHGRDLEGGWVEKEEGVEQVRQPLGIDLRRRDGVAISLPHVPALVVGNTSPRRGRGAAAARGRRIDSAGAEAVLAGRKAVLGLRVVAVDALGATPAVVATAQVQSAGRLAVGRIDAAHGRRVAVGEAAVAAVGLLEATLAVGVAAAVVDARGAGAALHRAVAFAKGRDGRDGPRDDIFRRRGFPSPDILVDA